MNLRLWRQTTGERQQSQGWLFHLWHSVLCYIHLNAQQWHTAGSKCHYLPIQSNGSQTSGPCCRYDVCAAESRGSVIILLRVENENRSPSPPRPRWPFDLHKWVPSHQRCSFSAWRRNVCCSFTHWVLFLLFSFYLSSKFPSPFFPLSLTFLFFYPSLIFLTLLSFISTYLFFSIIFLLHRYRPTFILGEICLAALSILDFQLNQDVFAFQKTSLFPHRNNWWRSSALWWMAFKPVDE